MGYQYLGLETDLCDRWRHGNPDANGQAPEHAISDGGGNPCRLCLDEIPEGAGMLILAHRPFDILNPYAETGPIFLCEECRRYDTKKIMPPVMNNRARHLLKGYSADDRIIYGTGAIVETADVPTYLDKVFSAANVEYVHVRSATNNCFTLRIERAREV